MPRRVLFKASKSFDMSYTQRCFFFLERINQSIFPVALLMLLLRQGAECCVIFCHWLTSTGLLETDPATPFSLVMLLELLLGELGPEPGALLHADSIWDKKHHTS